MKIRCALMLCALLAAPQVFACGMTSKVVPFEPAPGSTPIEAIADGLPAPVVLSTEITRGIGTSHTSCNDIGLLTVMIGWPRGGYKLRDLGFEFRIVSGKSPYPIFPEGPVQGPISGRKTDFLFMWRDGPPAQHKTLDLQVEVRAVTRDNQRGPPALILMRADAGD